MQSIKITALLPHLLIDEVKELTKEKQSKNTITESLHIALSEWVKLQKMKRLIRKTEKTPLLFSEEFSASDIRSLNRSV